MRLVIPHDNPSILRLEEFQDLGDAIAASLKYTDKAARFEYERYKNNVWAMKDPQYPEKLLDLKGKIVKSLLFQDEKGFYTYAGLAPYLSAKTRLPIDNQVQYPESKSLPWDNVPPFKSYYYQTASVEELLKVKHGGVELGTGLGKSHIIELLVKNLGLQTVIMTPSTNISQQLYDNFVIRFGKKKVGRFFDGKKELGKLITIANGQSLVKVTKDSEAWKFFSKSQVFMADESHQCPAKTLESVCFGLMASTPYRFFFSATQMRNDGKDLVLEGITGSIVYTKTVKEGVDEGFLARPVFRTFKVRSESGYTSRDAAEMSRHHMYYNDNVNREVAKIVNTVADTMPTVILIDEIEQFVKLLPYLRHKVGFAHGNLTPENKKSVPPEYWKSDPAQLVKEFNKGEIPVLIGTSCINTGTDLKIVKMLVNLQGNKSEILVTQSVGRATRLAPGKTSCVIVDVDIENIPMLHKHYEIRKGIYQSLFPDFKEV